MFFLRVFSLSFLLSLSACLIENSGFSGAPLYDVDECYFTRDLRIGKSIKWDKADFPIPFYIHDSVPDEAYWTFVASVELWNIRWVEYMEDKGLNGAPLIEIVGRGQKFALSGSTSPLRDKYNMLIFTDAGEIEKMSQQIDAPINEIQAITMTQRYRSERSRVKTMDIFVNRTHHKFFYDKEYNKSILAFSKKQAAHRRLALTQSLSFTAVLKKRWLRFVSSFLSFFKKRSEKREPARFARSPVPEGYVDASSLFGHEVGHVEALAHVDDTKDKGALTSVSFRKLPFRRLASRESQAEREKASSIMKVRLIEGTLRREISEFDLDNLFCGYYEGER